MQDMGWTLLVHRACIVSKREGEPNALAYDGDVFKCSTCLLGFHAKCDAQMGELIKVSLGSARGEDGRVMAPFTCCGQKVSDSVQQAIEQIEHSASTVDIACSARRRKTNTSNLAHSHT